MTVDNLKSFSSYSYKELQHKNLEAKSARKDRISSDELQKAYQSALRADEGIKAVTVCFSNIEGRLHMLDFDKDYFLSNYDGLTFDGSSVRGFSTLEKSDLRLRVDWSSLRWLPADVFGPGKVLFFAGVTDQDRKPFGADFRTSLKSFADDLFLKESISIYAAPEIEGMLLQGGNAEQHFREKDGFSLVSEGGYFHSLPQEQLRLFIDQVAETQRALGFENEKDHAEVAPSQFELNYKYGDVIDAADQVQLYKLVARQIAHANGMTATFLPKPISGINGNGMHINISLKKKGKNLFYDQKNGINISKYANAFASRILNHAPELSLILNSSVNAYRRLDPNYEAPNQIEMSATHRGAMIRVPVSNETGTRLEVRSVAPDANPYLTLYALLRTGLEGDELVVPKNKRTRLRYLPGTISDALRIYKASDFLKQILGEDEHLKYAEWKQIGADRCPKDLGSLVKNGEILYHHEVTNQVLWNRF